MTYRLGRAPGYMGVGRRGVSTITWNPRALKDPLIGAASAFSAVVITEASRVLPSKRRALIDSVLERVKPGTAADSRRRKAQFLQEGKNEDQATFDGMRLAVVNAIADRLVQAGKDKAAGRSVQGLSLYPWDPWAKIDESLGALGNIFEDAWNSVIKPALCVTGAVAGTIVSPAAGAIGQGQSAIGCNAKELATQRDIARLQAEQQASLERMQAAQLASRERNTRTLLIAGGIGAAVLITVFLIIR